MIHHVPLCFLPLTLVGHETKALLNNSGPRYKRSQLERQMNGDVLWCVVLLICMSLFSAVGKSPTWIRGDWVPGIACKSALCNALPTQN